MQLCILMTACNHDNMVNLMTICGKLTRLGSLHVVSEFNCGWWKGCIPGRTMHIAGGGRHNGQCICFEAWVKTQRCLARMDSASNLTKSTSFMLVIRKQIVRPMTNACLKNITHICKFSYCIAFFMKIFINSIAIMLHIVFMMTGSWQIQRTRRWKKDTMNVTCYLPGLPMKCTWSTYKDNKLSKYHNILSQESMSATR